MTYKKSKEKHMGKMCTKLAACLTTVFITELSRVLKPGVV